MATQNWLDFYKIQKESLEFQVKRYARQIEHLEQKLAEKEKEKAREAKKAQKRKKDSDDEVVFSEKKKSKTSESADDDEGSQKLGRWTKAELTKLHEAIALYGQTDVEAITKHIQTRTLKSVRSKLESESDEKQPKKKKKKPEDGEEDETTAEEEKKELEELQKKKQEEEERKKRQEEEEAAERKRKEEEEEQKKKKKKEQDEQEEKKPKKKAKRTSSETPSKLVNAGKSADDEIKFKSIASTPKSEELDAARTPIAEDVTKATKRTARAKHTDSTPIAIIRSPNNVATPGSTTKSKKPFVKRERSDD